MATLVVVLEYLENMNAVSGLLLSTVLLYAIRQFSGAHFGAYKNLLTAFAVADIFLVILHAAVHPRTVLVGYTHGIVSDTRFDDRSVTALYIAFQSVPFTLLIIRFLYRYLIIRRSDLIHHFSNKAFVLLLSAVIVGEFSAWYLMSMYATTSPDKSIGKQLLVVECERKYGRHIENAWIVLDHWRDNKFDIKLCVTIVATNALMLSSIILAATLATLTFHHIRTFGTTSIQSARLQRKMLIALCVQASTPLLFVHVPSLIAINLPYFRLSGGGIHDFVSPVYTCFPVWDAAVILLLIPDYRQGLRRTIWPDRVPVASTFHATTIA